MDLSKSIRQAMEKHELTDERELFRALLFLLKHNHVLILQGPGPHPVFCPSLVNIAGDGKTLAEFVRNLAFYSFPVHETQERGLRAAGQEAEADNVKAFIANMRAVVDMLDQQLPSWTAEADQYQAGHREFREQMLKNPRVVRHPPGPLACPTCGQSLPT